MKSRVPKQFQGGGQDMNSMIHQARKMQIRSLFFRKTSSSAPSLQPQAAAQFPLP